LENPEGTVTLNRHTAPVLAVAFSPDGKRLATGSIDPTVRLWEPDKSQEPLVFKDDGIGGTSIALSPDGTRLASVTASLNTDATEVRLWDLRKGQEPLVLKEQVGNLAFSPDGKCIAGGGKKTVHLWDVDTGSPTRIFKLSETASAIIFSPDSK